MTSKVSRLDVVTGTPAHEKTQGRAPCRHRGSTRPANPGNQGCQGPGVPGQVQGQTLSGSVRPIPRQTSRQGHYRHEFLLCAPTGQSRDEDRSQRAIKGTAMIWTAERNMDQGALVASMYEQAGSVPSEGKAVMVGGLRGGDTAGALTQAGI